MKIETLTESHYPFVSKIYEEGIATKNSTFQTEAYTWDEWNKGHINHSRLVAIKDNLVLGWAALSQISNRAVYSGVAEVSIYIGEAHRGLNIGNQLMQELIKSSESNNIWTLQAGMFPENIASLTLHQNNGFRIIGHREKIGKMNNTWRDTILLERRSKIAGL